jgi:hypothetical protein
LPWTVQRAYLEGLEADGTITRDEEAADGGFPSPAEGGPTVRRAEAGTDVIDITAMRDELERRRGGDR